MSRPMDTYDEISIAEIVFFAIFLVVGVFLGFKHGWSQNSTWRYAIVLSLARLIGCGMRLASIADPTNYDLYIGWLVTNSVGLGPLILILLGLCKRLFESINRQGHVVVNPIFQHAIELLMLVGMILLIVGGTEADYTLGAGGRPKVTYPATSQAGMALMIVVMVLVIAEVGLLFRKQGMVSQGEHRIFIAIGISLPFVMVRLIYSAIVIYAGIASSPWLYLGMSVIMEIVVVLVCEAIGLTVGRAPPMPKLEQDQEMQSGGRMPAGGPSPARGGRSSRGQWPRRGLIGGLISHFRK